jgi:hypothetical protein
MDMINVKKICESIESTTEEETDVCMSHKTFANKLHKKAREDESPFYHHPVSLLISGTAE